MICPILSIGKDKPKLYGVECLGVNCEWWNPAGFECVWVSYLKNKKGKLQTSEE